MLVDEIFIGNLSRGDGTVGGICPALDRISSPADERLRKKPIRPGGQSYDGCRIKNKLSKVWQY